MSTEEDGKLNWIIRHWYIWIAFLAIGVAIGIGQSAGPTPDTAAPKGTQNSTQEDLRKEFSEKLAAQEENAATTEEKTTDTVIQEHQQRLDELEKNPAPDESAALLSALGNLHKQKKRDYKAAAGYYEQLIEKYPDWPGVNAIYHQLISCYTLLDDQISLRILYRKMVDVFPPESKEYEYANAVLDGKL
tara:strand:- start:18 stop:584 length:567 start_codon:yes stop_codon:yes gene_type:complete